MNESIHYDWTLTYVIVLAMATATTGLTLLLSFKHIKVGDSAIQYITYSVCRMYFIYSLVRLLLYVGVLANFNGLRDTLDALGDGKLMRARVVYSSTKEFTAVAVSVALIGDCALLCTTFFIMMLAYELKRLIIKTMDRGPKRERAIIRQYCIRAYITAIIFAIAMVVSAFLLSPSDKSEVAQTAAFWFEMACVWSSVLYPTYVTIWISRQKRTRIAVSPASLLLHHRIKTFVTVYCAFVFPSCVVEVLARLVDDIKMEWVGVTQILYYFSGAGAAFAIGTSATCCYRALRPLMPSYVHEQLVEGGFFQDEQGLDTMDVIVEAPTRRPIFVVTDIEGSSQLWAAISQSMAEAQSIHDDLLRQQLPCFRGYEITTAGDSFQLAFHCVGDAIGWCISVQEKLLKALWPAPLLECDNAARVYDKWTRLLFNGLRVRMAIHDGDERLVCSRHPTTGKMTYLGLSEMMVRDMSAMGQGGQIVISESALAIYKDELLKTPSSVIGTKAKKFRLKPFRTFDQPEWNISLPMYEIVSTRIGDRFNFQTNNRHRERLQFLLPFWSKESSTHNEVLAQVRPQRSLRLSYSYSQCSHRSRSGSVESDVRWSERTSSIASEFDGSELLDVDDLQLLQQETAGGCETVRVTVRFRPLLSKEKSSRSAWNVHTSTGTVEAALPNARRRGVYVFDEVYDTEHSTRTIYDGLARSIARSALDGIHGSIFAYGQTSSGKTYTMQGSGQRIKRMTLVQENKVETEEERRPEDDDGLVQLAVKDLFDEMARRKDVEYFVRVSYLEVYNETVKDLLASNSTEGKRKDSIVHIREHPVTGVFTDNSERVVTDVRGVLLALRDGEKHRSVGITRMNERSSRSHSIFRLVIESKTRLDSSVLTEDDAGVDCVRVGCLNFVDLAGSESARAVSSGGTKLKTESGNINRSLLALSRVVVALGSSKLLNGQDHINFRDSKLTRILQPSLSGAARVLFVCCASPAPAYIEDTRSTLKFASRAKRIKVNASVNEVVDQRTRALMELARENQLLRQQMEALASASRDEIDAVEEHVVRLRLRVVSLEAAAAAPAWTSSVVIAPDVDTTQKRRQDRQPEVTGLERVSSPIDMDNKVLQKSLSDEEDTDVGSQLDSSTGLPLLVANTACPTCETLDDALEVAKMREIRSCLRIEQLKELNAQLQRQHQETSSSSAGVIRINSPAKDDLVRELRCVLDVADEEADDDTKALSSREEGDARIIAHVSSLSLASAVLLALVVDVLKKRSPTEAIALVVIVFACTAITLVSFAWNIIAAATR
ncbi:hypothetical protein DD238_004924 [Peronospora effusa]|uniref:Kinesin motor domain-containing protein n=1 Tax=Peronospora effusa TaxID=542832 RepID=A0A3M6VHX2_9STRA|nr:hypothetical protein DD238_004924 [Peronospora effusa]RQM18377.1 hypothetical protein DD237_002925 [Peronospora effusa]